MEFVNSGKKIFISIIFIILLFLVISYQYQITRAGALGGLAEGEDWKINYSLQKESRGEWLIDFNFLPVDSDQYEIQETQVVFADPVDHDVLTKARGSNENYRFEGHVLSNTKKLNEKEITNVLKNSYIIVKWLDETGKSVEEKIFLKN